MLTPGDRKLLQLVQELNQDNSILNNVKTVEIELKKKQKKTDKINVSSNCCAIHCKYTTVYTHTV